MRPENRTDYKVVESTRTLTGAKTWTVMVGGDIRVTTCNTPEHAYELAKNLNLDTYFLERGQTRADRIKAYDAYEKASVT
jgi:hypothetical protein|tara:strand:- start:311 stop:550 length:240 start_codon:yes stop_codon:yes gene_type:complete